MRTIESRIVQKAIRRNQQALDDLYAGIQQSRRLTIIDGGQPDHAPLHRNPAPSHWRIVTGSR